MANKYPGYCVGCSRRVGAGHGELTRSETGAWVVDCSRGEARTQRARDRASEARLPTTARTKRSAEPRKAGACEKADGIVVGSTLRLGVRDASTLVGEVFRAGKGWDAQSGQVVIVVGAETFFQSDEDNEDMSDMGGGGWGATRYVRLATEEEAAPVLAREAAAREAIEAPKRVAAARDAAALAQVEALPHVKPADIPELGEVGEVAYRTIREQLVRGGLESTICPPAGSERGRRIVWTIGAMRWSLALLVAPGGAAIGLVEDSSSYDDWRTYYHVSPAVAVAARRAHLARLAAEGHAYTARAAVLSLARFSGCEGAELARQVLADAGIMTPPTVAELGLTCLAKDEEIEAALLARGYALPAVEVAEGAGEACS